ncbi:type I polyketide synthase [Bacillus velezensis]|uniref:type I polyketide synthase n=1 Tax=Bacillus velezensis TaxID=492670 RepID=UPI000B0F5446|nr:type I polyketide synthase [Bacillus velezensis]AWK45265.1 short-chain dehydrogenase [Bacillus velezensis]
MADAINSKLLKQSLYTIQKLRNQLDDAQKSSSEPVAVVGMACRFPGGCNSPEEYWELLKAGTETIIDIPEDRWSADDHYDPSPETIGQMYVKQGSFLKRDVSEFDAKFFKISSAEANSMDPQHRQLLEVCWESLENAGQNPTELRGSKTGVFIGISGACEYAMLPQDKSKVNQYIGTGTTSSIASGRISYVFGLNGPSLSIDTACSSSLVTTHLAVESLRRGECNMALSGGVNLMLSPIVMSNLCMMDAVSRDGRCKPFDANGSGYGRGEGCGVLVLKRLSDAEKDGDTIYAVIRGGAVNNDGSSSGLTVPNGKAQKMVIESALDACSLKPEQISYLEAHGTGTPLGDPIEIGAVTEIFGNKNGEQRDNPLVIGAVKGNIGHLESAAGIASVIKVVLSLHYKEIPRIVNSDVPNPRINLKKIPAVLPREHMKWEVSGEKERIAGISSFGFSGTNAHMILSEAPLREFSSKNNFQSNILFLSAKDERALIELISRYDEYFVKHPEVNIEDVCYVTNACRSSYVHRAVFVGNSIDDFREGFLQVLNEAEKKNTIYADSDTYSNKLAFRMPFNLLKNNTVYTAKINEQFPPKIAFVFNGNTNKTLESSVLIYNLFPIFKREFDECLKHFEPYYGTGLVDAFLHKKFIKHKHRYMYLFAVQYAMIKLIESFGVKPEITFGERTGKYIAAVTAGIMSVESAVKHFVEAQNIISKVNRATHYRIFADRKNAGEILNRFIGKVHISAIYSKNEFVLSGQAEDINRIVLEFQSRGIKTVEEVESDWPSGLFEDYANDYGHTIVDEVYFKPKCRYISESSGETIRNSQRLTTDYWKKELFSPVQYEKSFEFLYQQGYRYFVEIGDSSSLKESETTMYQKDGVVHIPLISDDQNSLYKMLQGMAKLICLGMNINWQSFYEGYSYYKIILPNYPFAKTKHWITQPDAGSFNETDLKLSNALKGKEISLPYRHKQYEYTLSYKNLPELMDNSGVVHVGYYIEMLADTIRNLYGNVKFSLKNMDFFSPIMIFEGEMKDILLALEDNDGIIEFHFYSKDNEQIKWNLHVQGNMTLKENSLAADESLSVESVISVSDMHDSGEDFYKLLEEEGFHFGPSVRWVDEIWHKEGEALISIKQNTNSGDDYALYLHPGVIDSCAQVFNFISTSTSSGSKKFMISNLGESTFRSINYKGKLFAQIRISEYNDKSMQIKGDIKILGEDGKTIIMIDNVIMKEFDEEYMGAMKELLESTSASQTDEDKDFLLKYSEADHREKVELLIEYVRGILASIVEMEPEELDVNEQLDNFGLDSMMGLRFHGKLSQLLGAEFSFVEVIQSTTITTMALELTKFLPGGESLAEERKITELQAEEGIGKWIYDYKPNSEAKVRLFCFPYGFGSADMYREWKEKLGPEVDVCPIKLPGLDFERMKEETPTDIDEFMDTLIVAISDVIYDIPCMTFGHSWGSLFAYRLGNKLAKTPGVNYVKLFVSGYTAPILPNTSLMQILEELKLLGINHIPDFDEIKATSSIDMVSRAFLLGWGVEDEVTDGMLEGTKLTLPLIISAYRIIEKFQYNHLEDFDIPIVGFHGIDDQRVLFEDMNAWEDITKKSFTLYTMAGDHVFIDKSQSEERIIELLNKEIYESMIQKID